MKKDLKVGMSFRVFEISPAHYNEDNIGKWFSEQFDIYYNNPHGVTAPLLSEHQDHVGIDERGHGVLKGKLTITKLK